MKKLLRKILALSLVFVLICLCGVNAFAADYNSYEDSYKSGQYEMYINYSISDKSTGGTVYVMKGNSMYQNSYLYVSVTSRFDRMVGANYIPVTEIDTDTQTGAYQASAGFSDPSIYRMYHATYTFAADMPGSSGMHRCQINTNTIYYP